MIDHFRTHSGFWRRLAYGGARYGPRFWVRYSPPLFGVTFSLLLRRERVKVLDNLRRIHGSRFALSEAYDVIRTFASFASCLAESLAAERPEAEKAECRVFGEERLQAALAEHRGVIVVTAHAGPWDAAARLLANRVRAEVMVVMKRENDGSARSLHDDVRRQAGVTVSHIGADALDGLPLLAHLRKGGVVALQLDRIASERRTFDVTLFGERFFVPQGPFQLASLAQAPIVPLFAHRLGYFKYQLFVGEPLRLKRRASLCELTMAANSATSQMEQFLRAHPTQWFHFSLG